ncbi:uncharacterized protein METZ01_LOCUS336261, partial [marine metagenome]
MKAKMFDILFFGFLFFFIILEFSKCNSLSGDGPEIISLSPVIEYGIVTDSFK